MRIKRIELYNFGSYEGLNVFDTAGNSEEERIIIIGGKNGAGKTTLFTAIQVCLYGHAAFGYKASGKLYLKEVFNLVNSNARMDETKTAYVRIVFTETRVDVDEYQMTRSWTWSNGHVSEYIEISKNDILLNNDETVDFQNYLLHLIPPELLNLYFFDGEKIADFFLSEQHNNIKDALLILSGNDTYEILYSGVRRLLIGTESDAKNVSQDYTDQKDAHRRYCEEEKRLQEVIATLSADLEQDENELREENSTYASDGGISLEEWKDLQKQLRDEEEKREKLNAELKSVATDILPFVVVKSLLERIIEQIETERELKSYQVMKKKISSRSFRKHLFETMECIGSENASTDAEKVAFAIQQYFHSNKMEKSKILFDMSEDEMVNVAGIISAVNAFDTNTIAKYRSEIEASIQRSKEIREYIQKSSIENYEEHIRRVGELTARIEKTRVQLQNAQEQENAIQEEIEKVQKALDATRKVLEVELKKQSVSALSDRMMLLVEELQEKQYQKLLSSVEKDLNEKFKQLIRKEGFVDHIYLDSTFGLHLIREQEVDVKALCEMVKKHGVDALKRSLKRYGYNALIERLGTQDVQSVLSIYSHDTIVLPIELDHTHFSNGEKQILVMALYWALMKQSRNELPFIIDTPFARIDTEHRSNITEKLFKELNGQLFVLSTNEELRHEHLQTLDEQIARVYMLEYGEDKRTSITEGSYFEV